MDFLDPQKRKKHNRRILIGYGLLVVLIGMVSTLLLFGAYGYTYNVHTGNISQNGLLFVDANPRPGGLFLNGEFKGETDKRLVLDEGVYEMSLQREGYHNWERSVVLEGGVIERFQYPFLFPAEPESRDVELFSARPDFATQSPDRQWLVVGMPGDSIRNFEIINLNQETIVPERFRLPRDVLTTTGDTHRFESAEWSTNNRHFVMRHRFSGGSEYILVDRQEPQLSRNLSEVIDVPFNSLRLHDKLFDSYYLYNKSEETLRRYDLADRQVTPVLNNVLAYHPHGDDEILYVTDRGSSTPKTVSLRMAENGNTFTIRELPKSEKYMLELAQYEGQWYPVAAASSEERVYVFQDPTSVLRTNKQAKIIPEAVLRVGSVNNLSFSQNARIIAAQGGSDVAVYDAEREKTHHYDTELAIGDSHEFVWMDGHRLTAIIDGTQQVFDFDGTNRRALGGGYSGTQPYFNQEYNAVYTISPSINVDGRAALQRTELLTEEDQ